MDVSSTPHGLWKIIQYIRGNIDAFEWEETTEKALTNNAGVFPRDEKIFVRFGERMQQDAREIDILGSWLPNEYRMASHLTHAKVVPLADLEPYYHKNPWSEALRGKKVLVIHPFAESIQQQYTKHTQLFKDPRVLPDFELITLKAVQSSVGTQTKFQTWFEALDWMCEQIDRIDFDIALIGAGAYGLPLAAHIKRIGHKSVHLGGATQILFGIRGKRWDENPFFQNSTTNIGHVRYQQKSQTVFKKWKTDAIGNPKFPCRLINQIAGNCNKISCSKTFVRSRVPTDWMQVSGWGDSENLHVHFFKEIPKVLEESSRVYITPTKLKHDNINFFLRKHLLGTSKRIKFMPLNIHL